MPMAYTPLGMTGDTGGSTASKGGSGFSHSCFLSGFSDQPGGFLSFSDPHFLFISLISLCFPWLANPGKTEKNPGKLGKTWKKKQAPGKSTQTQEPQVLHLVPATCPETERCQGTMSFTIDGGAEGKAGGVCEERQTAHLGPLQRARAHTHTHRETERCQGTMSFRRQRGADDRQKISPPVTEKWDGGRENACLAQVGLFRSGTLTVDDSFRARERGGKVRTHSMLEQQKS